jgi:hypothetical protein
MTSLCQDCLRDEYGCDCIEFKDTFQYPTIYYGAPEDVDLIQLRMNKSAITLLIVAMEELRHQRIVRGSKEGGVLIGECDHVITALNANKEAMARFVPKE